jgi:spore germination protein KA
MAGSDLLSSDVKANETIFRDMFAHCSDVVFRPIPSEERIRALAIYIDGLVDTRELENTVLQQLIDHVEPSASLAGIAAAHVTTSRDIHETVEGILRGHLFVIADGAAEGLLLDFSKFAQRGIEEPVIEASVRGPREGFTEALRTNTSMIRRKLCTPRLKMEAMKIGAVTGTDVVLTYLEGAAPDDLVREARDRLRKVRTDSVLDSSYIEEIIQDNHLSPFPQLQNTERPDTVAASLLEGKVAILVNGSPNVLVAPMTFWNGFQAAEDHYEKSLYVSAVKLIRLLLFLLSLVVHSF